MEPVCADCGHTEEEHDEVGECIVCDECGGFEEEVEGLDEDEE